MKTAMHKFTKRFHGKLVDSGNKNEYKDVYFQLQLEKPFGGGDTTLGGFCSLTGRTGTYIVSKDDKHLFDIDIDSCGVIHSSRNIEMLED